MSEPLSAYRASRETDLLRELLSLEELYRRYRGAVQQYLYQLCGSIDLAEELTQEVFLKASVGLLGFRGECS
ncbi:MAG: hypothetical protein H7Y32_15930, partial [Chloroflexales bacterium]|nr:hypothetical protein [Chloroflexales bacterium]